MKTRNTQLLFAFLIYALSGSAQTETEVNTMVALIRYIPEQISKPRTVKNRTDVFEYKSQDLWYGRICRYGKDAIPFLIEKLNDSTKTNVVYPCENTRLSIGDIAMLLIDEIERIPFATITKKQWCFPASCGRFPEFFFSYFQKHRDEFQRSYREYYLEKRRMTIKSK